MKTPRYPRPARSREALSKPVPRVWRAAYARPGMRSAAPPAPDTRPWAAAYVPPRPRSGNGTSRVDNLRTRVLHIHTRSTSPVRDIRHRRLRPHRHTSRPGGLRSRSRAIAAHTGLSQRFSASRRIRLHLRLRFGLRARPRPCPTGIPLPFLDLLGRLGGEPIRVRPALLASFPPHPMLVAEWAIRPRSERCRPNRGQWRRRALAGIRAASGTLPWKRTPRLNDAGSHPRTRPPTPAEHRTLPPRPRCRRYSARRRRLAPAAGNPCT